MSDRINKITSCEVCGNSELIPVLDLGSHPMCDDLIPIENSQACQESPIIIGFCKNCITAHQLFQVPKKELFPASYHYRARFTADVLNGMKKLVASCEQRTGSLKNKKVLDIGCNDGSLLDFFREKGSITFGIEPTDACYDAELNGHVTYNSFLSEKIAQNFVSEQGHPDIITFTNVFAHIENLPEVLASLKILMAENTIIVIENHYLGSVLDGNQFDTFYHEHPRTYSYKSFEYMANSLGISVVDVEFPARYGGNIRVFLGNSSQIICKNKVDINSLKVRESHFLEHFLALQNKITCWKKNKLAVIQAQVQKHGKLYAKAFPGRAAILVKLLGLDEKLILSVHEKPGSLKIGNYVPGTKIPILSDEELFSLNDKTQPILNFAWHISKEIYGYLLENEYTGPIVDIVSPEDFFSAAEHT